MKRNRTRGPQAPVLSKAQLQEHRAALIVMSNMQMGPLPLWNNVDISAGKEPEMMGDYNEVCVDETEGLR